jgi:hypothetical protein
MSNCAEAHYKLTVCGHIERDGDHDGIPCENVCGKTLEIYQKRLREQGVDPEDPRAAQGSARSGVKRELGCGTKPKCDHLLSCEEALFYLNVCGVRSLDGDRDGTPCDNLCGGR